MGVVARGGRVGRDRPDEFLPSLSALLGYCSGADEVPGLPRHQRQHERREGGEQDLSGSARKMAMKMQTATKLNTKCSGMAMFRSRSSSSP
jgi:hypothetical protein